MYDSVLKGRWLLYFEIEFSFLRNFIANLLRYIIKSIKCKIVFLMQLVKGSLSPAYSQNRDFLKMRFSLWLSVKSGRRVAKLDFAGDESRRLGRLVARDWMREKQDLSCRAPRSALGAKALALVVARLYVITPFCVIEVPAYGLS